MTLLITGGTGYLGGELVRQAGAAAAHPRLELLDPLAVRRGFEELRPSAVLDDYGRSKLEAERRVVDLQPAALVARTSLLVARERPGRQEQAVLEAARGQRDMTFFEDEWRSPILVADLATALLELAEMDLAGILHVAGAEPLNRYQLACMIAAAHGEPTHRLRSGSLAESRLERAANCVLDSSLARSLLSAQLPRVPDRIGRAWKSGSGG